MKRTIGLVSLLVRAYDEAVAHCCGVLGFRVVENTALGGGNRRDLLERAKATRRWRRPGPLPISCLLNPEKRFYLRFAAVVS